MELVNPTKLAAGYSMATDKTGREWVIIVVKGTFGFPASSRDEPVLLEEQVPLVEADEFTDAPATSSLRYELDFALRKPRCDVLLVGNCHAPGGQAAKQVSVAMRVGGLSKWFNVVGDRVWKPGALHGVTASAPRPFVTMPLSYDNAYGGVDRPSQDPNTHRYYVQNPVGRGFHPKSPEGAVVGRPLPNTEEPDHPITRPGAEYRPMAFGPLSRSWRDRIRWAGTYDAQWKKNRYPFLPDDFDERYFQSAPEDQQIDYLTGGELVVLLNLTPEGRVEFKLPRLAEPFDINYKNGDTKRITGVVDTLVLEPEARRFTMCLRASVPLKRSLHELWSVEIGRVLRQPVPAEGERQQPRAKPHYRSLGELAEARRAARKADGS